MNNFEQQRLALIAKGYTPDMAAILAGSMDRNEQKRSSLSKMSSLEQMKSLFARADQDDDSSPDSAQNVASVMAFKPSATTAKGTNTPPKLPILEPVTNKATTPPGEVRMYKGKASVETLEPRTLEQCWGIAVRQYGDQGPAVLGKAYRIAVAARAVALWQNPQAHENAHLTAFLPSMITLAEWLGMTESYMWRIISGKLEGMTQNITKIGKRERSSNAALERCFTWKVWWTDWECHSAPESKRFADGGRRTVKGGTVIYTRPKIASEGTRLYVPSAFMKKRYRDLESDVKARCTAASIRNRPKDAPAKIRQKGLSSASKYPEEKSICLLLKPTLHSSLIPLSNYKGVNLDTELSRADSIYVVLDELNAPLEKGHNARTAWVQRLARRICYVLRDNGSLDFWQRTLWTLLRCRIYEIGGALETLHHALVEAAIRSGDNPLIRRPGAIAVKALYANGWRELESAVKALKVGEYSEKELSVR